MPIPNQHDKRNCGMCGRWIATDLRKHSGKGMFRHKCPHGKWCPRGERLTAGDNEPRCKECRKLQRDSINKTGTHEFWKED